MRSPSTTLLITTHNRGHLLRANLERLATLTIPDDILVVDDGGSDDTKQVCESFKPDLPIRYLYHNNPGPTICSFARNIGIRHIESDLIVTAEPELIFVSDVIAQLLAARVAHPGKVISAGTVDFLATDGKSFQRSVGWVAPYTAIYDREWLLEVGGWDEGFPGPWGWDDTDLLTRLRLSGIGQYIDLDITVEHQWHGFGGDAGSQNERYFFAKSFHADHDTNPDLTDVVANRGIQWGALSPRRPEK